MSLSGALSNALSGLTASSRTADVAASNIANAMTEGYGVRQAVLVPRAIGDEGGVRIQSIQRLTNQVLIADRRTAEADLSSADVLSTFFTRMQNELGLPNESGSLSDRLTQLESSLTEATASPEDDSLLRRVLGDLVNLTDHINQVSDTVQTERVRADAEISTTVDELNSTLQQIEKLNDDIRRYLVLGHDTSAMLDQRQVLIDKVNEYIPVKELDRGHGAVALMTEGGTLLLDGKAKSIEFTEHAVITADMSLSGGTLSGLTIDGRSIDVSGSPRQIAGGKLDALFEIRDVEAVQIQAQLDGFARDLIERFENSGVDTTLASGDPGLLTDSGAKFSSSNEPGLAQRISVNALVDPAQGGDLWHLREGLGALTPGDGGRSDLLIRLSEALENFSSPSSAAFSGGMRTASSLASDLASHIGSQLESANTNRSFAQSQYSTLKEMELAEGVDTDAEMQKLLLIEQAYSANARVVQVVNDMLDWLMRI